MARLPEEIITTVLALQRQLLERLDEATATEFVIQEQFGETGETIDYFEQLQNSRERADRYYSRLYLTLRRIYESQPVATRDTLELLYQFIAESEAVLAATDATIREIRRDFNLP